MRPNVQWTTRSVDNGGRRNECLSGAETATRSQTDSHFLFLPFIDCPGLALHLRLLWNSDSYLWFLPFTDCPGLALHLRLLPNIQEQGLAKTSRDECPKRLLVI